MIRCTRRCCQRFSLASDVNHLEQLVSELFLQQQKIKTDPCDIEQREQQNALVSIIRDCRSLPLCKKIHATVARDLRQHLFLSNLLIEAYCRCGSLDDAAVVFNEMLVPKNEVSWTILIAANARLGHLPQAFYLFHSMQLEGVRPDRVTHLTILGACSDPQALPLCRLIHAQLTSMGFGSEPGFVKSYSMCGDLAAARDAFDRIVNKSVSCWNALMIAYEEREMFEEILELYRSMDSLPNETTMIKVLGACSAMKNSAMGKVVHKESSRIGLDLDIFVANATLTMYTKCDQIEEANRVLENSAVRDVVSWNIILAANARSGQFETVLELFHKMDQEGIKPSSVSFVTLIQSLAHIADLDLARSIHSRVLASGVKIHDALHNALLNLYAKLGGINEAGSIFWRMPARNLVSWNTMISACLDWNEFQTAIEFHRRMDLEGIRGDAITFAKVLTACSVIPDLVEGRSIHAQILASPSRVSIDLAVRNALAAMYAACGEHDLAKELLEESDDPSVERWSAMISSQETLPSSCLIYRRMLLDGIRPNHVSFLAVIAACEKELSHRSDHDRRASIQESFDRIQEHIQEMGLELVPVVTTALMSFHTKLGGGFDQARALFQRLQHRSEWPWVTMMSAANSSGDPTLALEFFRGMLQDGIDPDEIAFTVALAACKCLPTANALYSWYLESLIQSSTINNIAINIFGRFGAAESARTVFDSAPTDRQDPVAWGSMITAYAQSGQIRQALDLHCAMVLEGIEQDVVTFVSLLFSCSHGGLAKKAIEIFVSMQRDYYIDPVREHYSCIVDLLGRCGHLRDAEKLLDAMPVEPNVAQWVSLLNACSIHLDPERGERVANVVHGVDPSYRATYNLLPSILVANL